MPDFVCRDFLVVSVELEREEDQKGIRISQNPKDQIESKKKKESESRISGRSYSIESAVIQTEMICNYV